MSPKTAYLDSMHVLHYSIGDSMPTALWTSESLAGLAKISQRLPFVLAAAYGGVAAPKVELYVHSVVAGTMTDNVVVRLIFGSEEKMNEWIKRTRQHIGVEKMNARYPLVGPVLTTMIVMGGIYGVHRMVGRDGSQQSGSTINLTTCSNIIIQQGASQLHVSPDVYMSLVRENTGNMFNVASNTCRILKPVKESGGDLVVDNDNRLTISAAAIKETPTRVDRAAEPPLKQVFENVQIDIRATDWDSRTKGWGVVIPAVTGRRLKMELSDNVSPDTVRAGRTNATVELFFSQTEEGDRIYKHAILRELK